MAVEPQTDDSGAGEVGEVESGWQIALEGGELYGEVGFGDSGDDERAVGERVAPGKRFEQAREDFASEAVFGFEWDAWHRDEHFAGIGGLEPHDGGCPDAVADDAAACRDEGLSGGEAVELQSAFAEDIDDVGGHVGVFAECAAEYFAEGLLGDVVACGAESSSGQDNVGATEGFGDCATDFRGRVGDDGHVGDFPTFGVHCAREEAAVGVDDLSDEEFVADDNNRDFHSLRGSDGHSGVGDFVVAAELAVEIFEVAGHCDHSCIVGSESAFGDECFEAVCGAVVCDGLTDSGVG